MQVAENATVQLDLAIPLSLTGILSVHPFGLSIDPPDP